MSIADNIAQVQSRIAEAAARAGRDPAEVTLVAVTKTFSTETVELAAAAGLRVFGENRMQEAAGKIPLLPDSFKWHMIGHVQTNKAKHVVGLFDCVQSVDSVRLAEALDRHAADQGRQLSVLLQVHLTGKASQSGFQPTELPAIARSVGALTHIRIDGLMAIASFTDDEKTLRAEFRTVRE
ncbi:MAG: YggS family pyridoxal phosphate-dependent enzyme, partial [Chloroflexota bacterium]|nr:YggS family pyridoxal phosphate-dependent enzyme [Chloroflexota bacterium]